MKKCIGILFLLLACKGFAQIGSGTENDPYLISNAQQLQDMKNNVAAHYRLTNDIDASVTSTWNVCDHDADESTPDSATGFFPIGSRKAPFVGTFNGAGYTIRNLYINRPVELWPPISDSVHTGPDAGLFGHTSDNATIDSIILEEYSFTSFKNIGSIVLFPSNTNISNCYTSGTALGTDTSFMGTENRGVGGIAAVMDSGSIIENCSTAGILETPAAHAGGIVGIVVQYGGNEYGDLVWGGRITHCHSSATVSGRYAGGIIGKSSGSGLQYCSSEGTIFGQYAGGGIIGWLSAKEYSSCGIVECFSTATVHATGYAGGLSGILSMDIYMENSYFTGSVSSDGIAGGLSGRSGKIYNSYFAGSISNGYSDGAIMGESIYREDLIDMCIWNSDSTSLEVLGKGYIPNKSFSFNKTTEAMNNIETFISARWDCYGETNNGAEDIWYMDGDKDFPQLRWTNPSLPTNIIDHSPRHNKKIARVIKNTLTLNKSDAYKLQIYSINGRIVAEVKDLKSSINLEHFGLAKGVYQMRLIQGGNVFTDQFIVK